MSDNAITGNQKRINEDEEHDEGEPPCYTAVWVLQKDTCGIIIILFLCSSVAQTQRYQCHYSGESWAAMFDDGIIGKTVHLPLVQVSSSSLQQPLAMPSPRPPPLLSLMLLRHHPQWGWVGGGLFCPPSGCGLAHPHFFARCIETTVLDTGFGQFIANFKDNFIWITTEGKRLSAN